MRQNYRVTVIDDLDRTVSSADYEESYQKLQALAADAGIPSSQVFQFGSIAQPGISDLDVLVQGRADSLKKLYSAFRELHSKDQIFAYIFKHAPILLLDHLAPHLSKLHTACSPNQSEAGVDSENTALNLAWHTFNTANVCRALLATKTSMRDLLLLQKNLAHSMNYFAELKGLADPIENCTVLLRKKAFEADPILKQELISNIVSTFNETNSLVDQYCNQQFGTISPQCIGIIICNRNTFLIPAASSSVSMHNSHTIIRTHRAIFQLTSEYILPKQSSTQFSAYTSTLRMAADEYIQSDLPNPFIMPFCLQKKRSLHSSINSALVRVSTLLQQPMRAKKR